MANLGSVSIELTLDQRKMLAELGRLASVVGTAAQKAQGTAATALGNAGQAAGSAFNRALSQQLGQGASGFSGAGKAAGRAYGTGFQQAGDEIVTGFLRSIGDSFNRALIGAGQKAAGAIFDIKNLGDYDAAARQIATLGANVKEFQAVAKNLTKELGYNVSEVTALTSLYDVLSSGVSKAADAGQTLRASIKLSTTANADLGETTKTLLTIMNSYNMKAGETGKITNKMFGLINAGQINGKELSQFLGEVAATASTAAVSLDEMFRIIAAATVAGVKPNVAITGMRAAIDQFTNLSKEGEDAAAELGVYIDSATLKSKGLFQVVKELEKAGASMEQINKIFASSDARKVINPLMGDVGTERYKAASKIIAETNIEGSFKNVSEGINKRIDSIGNKLQSLDVQIKQGKIGELIAQGLQYAVDAIDRLNDRLTQLGKWYSSLDKNTKATIKELVVFGGALAAVSVGVAALSAAFLLLNTAALPWIAAAAGIAAGLYLLYKLFQQLEPQLKGSTQAFKDLGKFAIEALKGILAGAIKFGEGVVTVFTTTVDWTAQLLEKLGLVKDGYQGLIKVVDQLGVSAVETFKRLTGISAIESIGGISIRQTGVKGQETVDMLSGRVANPSGVASPISNLTLDQAINYTGLPVQSPFAGRSSGTHHAIDYSAPAGTPVQAISAGTATYTPGVSYYEGKYRTNQVLLEFEQNGKKVRALYFHLGGESARYFKDGFRRQVQAGEAIGVVGKDGAIGGNVEHLDLKLWVEGERIKDPRTYLRDLRNSAGGMSGNVARTGLGGFATGVESARGSMSINAAPLNVGAVTSAVLRLVAGKEVREPDSIKGYFQRNGKGYFNSAEAAFGFPRSVGKNENIGRYQQNRGDWEYARRLDPSIKTFLPFDQDKAFIARMKTPGRFENGVQRDRGWTALQEFTKSPTFSNFVTLRKDLSQDIESLRDGVTRLVGTVNKAPGRNDSNFMKFFGLTDQQLYQETIGRAKIPVTSPGNQVVASGRGTASKVTGSKVTGSFAINDDDTMNELQKLRKEQLALEKQLRREQGRQLPIAKDITEIQIKIAENRKGIAQKELELLQNRVDTINSQSAIQLAGIGAKVSNRDITKIAGEVETARALAQQQAQLRQLLPALEALYKRYPDEKIRNQIAGITSAIITQNAAVSEASKVVEAQRLDAVNRSLATAKAIAGQQTSVVDRDLSKNPSDANKRLAELTKTQILDTQAASVAKLLPQLRNLYQYYLKINEPETANGILATVEEINRLIEAAGNAKTALREYDLAQVELRAKDVNARAATEYSLAEKRFIENPANTVEFEKEKQAILEKQLNTLRPIIDRLRELRAIEQARGNADAVRRIDAIGDSYLATKNALAGAPAAIRNAEVERLTTLGNSIRSGGDEQAKRAEQRRALQGNTGDYLEEQRRELALQKEKIDILLVQADALELVRAKLEAIAAIETDPARKQAILATANGYRDTIQQALGSNQAFKDSQNNLIQTGTAVTQQLRDSAREVFSSILGGAKNLGQVLDNLMNKLADIAINAAFNALSKSIFGFAYGGVVPNYANGVDAAMSKERAQSGKKPILAVLHQGEHVLSTLNGDAQTYARLKSSGAWESLKGVPNYATGTTVSSYASSATTARVIVDRINQVDYVSVDQLKGILAVELPATASAVAGIIDNKLHSPAQRSRWGL